LGLSSDHQLCQICNGRELTDARPALTPCRPVSQTSPSFSTSFKLEILIEAQEYVCLEVSIQGIESAIAVKHDNSCPSTDAASDHQLCDQTECERKLTTTGHLERILESLC
jgi:hypothetical protein